MKALFVHDHKFPKRNSKYFHSYGFDSEFFNRYLKIFDNLEILGREIEDINDDGKKNETVDTSVAFFSIKGYRELLSNEIRKKIRKKIMEMDALIVRLPSMLGLYAIYVAKKYNKPYIVELVGCPWDAFWYMGNKRKLLAPIIALATKLAIFSSNYVVYVSEKFLQSRYPTKGKSISCSNVTIHQVYDESLITRIKKIEMMNTEKNVVFGTIGTLDSLYKGQHYVIDAIAKLKSEGYSIEYQLVGGGDSAYLETLANELGVLENVKIIGKMKHEDIFNWLSNIDIYIQPSDTEGLPRSVIEAMSVACPIIGSNAGGIPELIEKSVVFDKGNVVELCEVYKGLTIEKLKEQSKINHENSKKFTKSILYKRRENFFAVFINNEIQGDSIE